MPTICTERQVEQADDRPSACDGIGVDAGQAACGAARRGITLDHLRPCGLERADRDHPGAAPPRNMGAPRPR